MTDERAPVTILVPQHPVFTSPNRITDADWDDWVQERNLYAWATFDPQYTPLLETGDPGEPRQRGGELYARHRQGPLRLHVVRLVPAAARRRARARIGCSPICSAWAG